MRKSNSWGHPLHFSMKLFDEIFSLLFESSSKREFRRWKDFLAS